MDGRAKAFLHVEALEDRSVPSTLSDELSSVVYASLLTGVAVAPAGATVTVENGSVSTSGLSGPGLDRLIAALQEAAQSSSGQLDTAPTQPLFTLDLTASSSTSTAASVTSDLNPGSPAAILRSGLDPASPPTTNEAGTSGGTVPDVTNSSGGSTTSSPVVSFPATSFSATSFPSAPISSGTNQGGSGSVGGVAGSPNAFLDPDTPEASPPTTPARAPSGPEAIGATQPALPDSRVPSGTTGLPIVPGGTSAETLQALSAPGANGTTLHTSTGTEVGILREGAAEAEVNGEPGPWTPLTDLSDGSLLQQFAVNREQAAFTTLVRRYEPSVLRVCTEVLGDSDQAQDASQATFQALARRAASLDGQAPLRGWLSTVAYRMALRWRANDARRRRLERALAARAAAGEEVDLDCELEREELREVIGDELNRLPAKYRIPLVLHYLEERTHAEVAREVGLPLGSVARRISDALCLLRNRLAARGFPF